MELALDPFLSWDDIVLGSTLLGERINDAYRQKFQLDKHSSLCDIERVCGSKPVEAAYRFALVRNPLSRVCSLYNFIGSIVMKWCQSSNTSIEQLRGGLDSFAVKYSPLTWGASRAFISANSFSEFLRNPILKDDSAYHSQVSRLRFRSGALGCEFFRLEERDIWLPILGRQLKCELRLEHSNQSEMRLISPAQLTAEDRALVRREFAEDYVQFGYSD